MAEYAADKRLSIPIRLLYSNHGVEDIAFGAELDELEKQNPRFRVHHTLTGDRVPNAWKGSVGRIDSGQLELASRGLKGPGLLHLREAGHGLCHGETPPRVRGPTVRDHAGSLPRLRQIMGLYCKLGQERRSARQERTELAPFTLSRPFLSSRSPSPRIVLGLAVLEFLRAG